MRNFIKILGVWVGLLSACALAGTEKMVLIRDEKTSLTLNLWTESFGNSQHTPILLIMGAGTQGIMWPTYFCESLAKKGYFVIRYDFRDAGQSSLIDYDKTPYNLNDLSKDAIAILDAYQLPKALVVGFSMGGMIAQFLGAKFPDRMHGLVMICTTGYIEPFLCALEKKPLPADSLPAPSAEFMKELDHILAQDFDGPDKEHHLLAWWKLLNGTHIKFDEQLYKDLVHQCAKRGPKKDASENHVKAMKASCKELESNLKNVSVPTLVIQAGQDPYFSLQHGQALVNHLPKAQLKLYPEMGHVLSPYLNDRLIQDIDRLMQKQVKKARRITAF